MHERSASLGSPARTIGRRNLLRAATATAVGIIAARSLRQAGAAAEPNSYPPALPVTSGPKHHFFGYYDKCPWDATGRFLLAMEIGFYDRQPQRNETLTVGMVDLKDGNRFIPFDATLAWCWQQGTMLQWLGTAPDRQVIYNSVADRRYVSIVRDVHSGRTRTLTRPIYALSRDGTQAVSLDFDRVNRLRPGYGYMALPERHADQPAPADAGLYWMDTKTGKSRMILSLEWAARNRPDERFKNAEHWFNHLQFSPGAKRVLFLHRWCPAGKRKRWTRLYTANPDGSDIRLLNDTGLVSHFDWRDDRTILAWARTKEKGAHFYLIDEQTGEHTVLGEDVLTADGHCSFSPDRNWVLNDTYPDKQGMQTLMLYHPADNTRHDMGRFLLPRKLRRQFYRCDLHPRWNRDGTQVCIDSAHGPTRQIYVIDVSRITQAGTK